MPRRNSAHSCHCQSALRRRKLISRTNGGVAIELGTLGPNDFHSRAYDITDARVIDCESLSPSSSMNPIRWTQVTSMQNLRSIAPSPEHVSG